MEYPAAGGGLASEILQVWRVLLICDAPNCAREVLAAIQAIPHFLTAI